MGYSPERINVGDKKHDLAKVIKLFLALIKKLLLNYQKFIKELLKQEFIWPQVLK